jgi:hypothetical protein
MIRKSACRCACALIGVHGAALDRDIDHILNSEHECALPRLPRSMVPIVILTYFIRPIELTVDNGAFMRGKNGIWLPKKELERPIHVCSKEQMARPSV